MQDLIKKLADLEKEDFSSYREVIQYCEKRITAEEGIPAIIGLDDLTDNAHETFEGAPMDQKMNLDMAIEALIFNWLYSKQDDLDPHYRSIAPAMSALAEKMFCIADGEVKQYRTMIGEDGNADS